MKQRLLVMNGQRLLQFEQNGEWLTSKVSKADGIGPGIYNISIAVAADKNKIHEGLVLHSDASFLFQKVSDGIVKHEVLNLKIIPAAGSDVRIKYGKDSNVVIENFSAKRRFSHGMKN